MVNPMPAMAVQTPSAPKATPLGKLPPVAGTESDGLLASITPPTISGIPMARHMPPEISSLLARRSLRIEKAGFGRSLSRGRMYEAMKGLFTGLLVAAKEKSWCCPLLLKEHSMINMVSTREKFLVFIAVFINNKYKAQR